MKIITKKFERRPHGKTHITRNGNCCLRDGVFRGGCPIINEDGEDEVDVLKDILIPRLEEYNENLPDHYGTLSVEELLELMAEEEDLYILDVREVEEIEEFGIMENAVNIPLRTLGENIALLPEDLDASVVVICKGGFRAAIAMTVLHILGYENAHVLVGGFDAWLAEELTIMDEAFEVKAGDINEDIDPLLLEYVAEYLENLPEGWGAVKPDALFEEMFDVMPDLLLDVRSEEERADPGYIEGAEWLWIDNFMAEYTDLVPEDFESNIVVYCASGYRASVVSTMLGLLGYENVRNMSGGLKGWIATDLPVELP